MKRYSLTKRDIELHPTWHNYSFTGKKRPYSRYLIMNPIVINVKWVEIFTVLNRVFNQKKNEGRNEGKKTGKLVVFNPDDSVRKVMEDKRRYK